MPWKEVSVMSQRLEFVQMASGEQANIRQLCRHFNISAPTAYKWLYRFQESGATTESLGSITASASFTTTHPC